MANANFMVLPLDRYGELIAAERDAQLLKNILKQKIDASEGVYASEVVALVKIFCSETKKGGK